MKTDNTKRASIRLQYKNISKIHFSAWKIDYADLVMNPQRSGRRHSHRAWMRYVKKKLVGTEPSHRWSNTLSETKDLKMHTHYVTPPFSERGEYIVVAHEGDRPDGEAPRPPSEVGPESRGTILQRDLRIGHDSDT